MEIRETPIPGLLVAESKVSGDSRGSFTRLFCGNELEKILGKRKIAQINHSFTKKVGSIRGLHFQKTPFSEMKLVRCLKGRVWDLAVDLRKDSPSFLKWHCEELTPQSSKMIIIPEGFAHGFQVLEENSELLYLHTEYYKPEFEAGISFDDPRLKISWPLPPSEISNRDKNHPKIKPDFFGLGL